MRRCCTASRAGPMGETPNAGVIRDSAGNLYGTTYCGGAASAGVVFKLDTAGNETVLYSFTGGTDGGTPNAGVIRDCGRQPLRDHVRWRHGERGRGVQGGYGRPGDGAVQLSPAGPMAAYPYRRCDPRLGRQPLRDYCLWRRQADAGVVYQGRTRPARRRCCTASRARTDGRLPQRGRDPRLGGQPLRNYLLVAAQRALASYTSWTRRARRRYCTASRAGPMGATPTQV